MIINTHIHASTTAADFAPAIWPLSSTETFSLAFEKNRSVVVFLTHDQMITLRDVLSVAIENSPFKCGVRECEEARVTNCENCDANFCADHGQKGGDREGGTNPNGSPHGAYAVPSICDSCMERSRA